MRPLRIHPVWFLASALFAVLWGGLLGLIGFHAGKKAAAAERERAVWECACNDGTHCGAIQMRNGEPWMCVPAGVNWRPVTASIEQRKATK
jgi:hypothetical protein